jgi:hypothetical protein
MLRDRPAFVRCAVVYYGSMDLQPARTLIPASVPDDELRAFSPIAYLAAEPDRVPPLYIARAGLDHPGLDSALDRFVQEALARNLAIILVNHPQGQHAFDIVDDGPRSREIIRVTLEFMRTHLASGA